MCDDVWMSYVMYVRHVFMYVCMYVHVMYVCMYVCHVRGMYFEYSSVRTTT